MTRNPIWRITELWPPVDSISWKEITSRWRSWWTATLSSCEPRSNMADKWTLTFSEKEFPEVMWWGHELFRQLFNSLEQDDMLPVHELLTRTFVKICTLSLGNNFIFIGFDILLYSKSSLLVLKNEISSHLVSYNFKTYLILGHNVN